MGKKKGKHAAQLHLEAVQAAYLAKGKPKGGGGARNPKSLANLKAGGPGNPDLHKIRRQCVGKRTDGKKCQGPAVRGADHCKAHGGMREAPQARGNIKRLLDGRLALWAAAHDAKQEIKAHPPEIVAAVHQHAAKSPHNINRAPFHINIAKGCKAYTAAKRGEPTQWQAWLADQPAIAEEFAKKAEQSPANIWKNAKMRTEK